jgi:SAM-dependent methyltransferase
VSFDQITAYRAASEALHRDHAVVAAQQRAAHYRILWECGLADLIREDFYGLLAVPEAASGNLLDAGCGTGFDALALRRRAPALAVHGVDISAVALTAAAAHTAAAAAFYQAALERLPFCADGFDYICSHEVIEHVEDPAVVLRELSRVLRPGGTCVIATPNGASWWIEHLRQRFMRLTGRRGAPIGEDHTRTPNFWRGEFAQAGFVIERQIFDGAALEFLLFVAPARWMPLLTRLLEPLRILPGINLVLCDRVKFRLRKPGEPPGASATIAPCCPVCHSDLTEIHGAVACASNHRFGRNAMGLIDFVAPLTEDAAPFAAALDYAPAEEGPPTCRPAVLRRLRRLVLLGFSLVYGGLLLLLLMPLGAVCGRFSQPFGRESRSLSSGAALKKR